MMMLRKSIQYAILVAVNISMIQGFSIENSRVFVSTPVSKFPKRVVSDYMDPLGHVLTPDMSVDETIQIFVNNNLAASPVVDRNYNLIGIVSSFDFLEKEAFQGALLPLGGSQELVEKYVDAAKRICGQRVEDIMSVTPSTVSTCTSMRDAAGIMAEKRLHRLPVLDLHGKLVGMLTTTHVMRDLMRVLDKLPASKSVN